MKKIQSFWKAVFSSSRERFLTTSDLRRTVVNRPNHLFYQRAWVEGCRASLAALSLLLALSAMAELPPPIHRVEISSPRDFGLVMGETLGSEIRVKSESGWQLDASSLPQPGSAVSDVLEVRQINWDQQGQGGENLIRINLTYQVFKGVREPETLNVPALRLRLVRNGRVVETDAPAWSFTLSPVIPSKTPDEEVVIRGNLPPPTVTSTQHWQWLAACLAGLIGWSVYASWRLGLPPFSRHRPPFVRAFSGLTKLNRKPLTLANYRQAAKLLHDALNETAGHILFSGHIPEFIASHPEYGNVRSELEKFFKMSDRLFFAENHEIPADLPLSELSKLCRKLASVKKMP